MARIKTNWSRPTFASTGESVSGDNAFEAVKEIKDCARRGQLSLLYIFNSRDGSKKIANFEKALFQNEKLALAMKVFRPLKLDVARDAVTRDRFGRNLPRFLIFNAQGRQVDDVVLKGYRASVSRLLGALVKASRGHGPMPLLTFVKKYRTFLNQLDKLEAKKATFAKKKARLKKAGARAVAKLKKLEKEGTGLAAEEQRLLAREKTLLEAVKAYTPASERRVVAAAGR